MNNREEHSKRKTDLIDNILETGAGVAISWRKSKEKIWLDLERKMESEQPAGKRVIIAPWIKIAAAASIVVLMGIAFFMQTYTKTIENQAGLPSQLTFPDHSTVLLNARTTLSYKPLMWKFARKVKFEGEAFFKVQKGSKFEVISANGITSVLGTSFTVYSRNTEYQVICLTGKVKVTETNYNQEVILGPGQKAIVDEHRHLLLQPDADTTQTMAWTRNRFSFTAQPLPKVFEEISRQYGVKITIPDDLDHTYTGSFIRKDSVEQVLNFVCKPFGLSYKQHPNNEYIITRSE